MRRLNSWTTLVHVDSSKAHLLPKLVATQDMCDGVLDRHKSALQAVWSRMPSMPLIEMSSTEEFLACRVFPRQRPETPNSWKDG